MTRAPRKALVVGGGGFLGRCLCTHLAESAREVLCVDRQRPENWAGKFLSADALESLADEFAEVYLVAATIPYGALDRFSLAMNATNIALPLKVVEQFPASRLVYASSVSVYGEPLTLPIDEGHPYNQPAAYALSKLAGEVAVRAHANHVVLRLPSLYGPGMAAATFIPAIIRQAQEKGHITLFGDGSRRQDYLHMRDAAAMFAVAGAGAATGVFNAVNGTAVTNLEAAGLVAELLGGVSLTFAGADNSPSCVYADERWQAAFGKQPKTALRDGLREMIEHG